MAAADAASRSSPSPLAAAAQAFADAAADGASLGAVLDDADLSRACVGWFKDADEAAELFAGAIFMDLDGHMWASAGGPFGRIRADEGKGGGLGRSSEILWPPAGFLRRGVPSSSCASPRAFPGRPNCPERPPDHHHH